MALAEFIKAMPKIELHVHLEGATQPATLLQLASRHNLTLPADTVAGIREWYRFTDFNHFIQIYMAISECIRTPDDIELLAREFLRGQAAQNICYSEVTYTAFTHWKQKGLSFDDQLMALNRARSWAEAELGVTMGLVIDIPRGYATPDQSMMVADWAVSAKDDGVVAFGLGGPEVGNPPEDYIAAFERAIAGGLPSVPHAGETVGPASIWGALDSLHAVRIGHGVRCLEDPALVDALRERQIPLEVSPTSNVCLGVAPTFAAHPLPRLLDAGLSVTLNSDDPPMFNTTLTDEYLKAAYTFGFDEARMMQFALDALAVSFLPEADRAALRLTFEEEFTQLRAQHIA